MDKPGFDESRAVAITGKIMVIAIIVLFLVMVFVLLLHLYAKWFWWRVEEHAPPQPSSTSSSRHNRRRFVFAPGQDAAHPLRSTKGLDPIIIASLPVLTFRAEDFKEGLECAVCLCELVQGEKARLLPKCNHGFHVDCIDMWFQSHSTCPLCRNPVSASAGGGGVELESLSSSSVMSENEANNNGDSPRFPTNVLFWGNQTQEVVSSASASSFASSSMAATTSGGGGGGGGSGRQEGMMLVIDVVPMNLNENNFPEEESKSPLPTRLRSLKRLLSRDKRIAPSTSGSNSVDV